jgi:hypothetical protein
MYNNNDNNINSGVCVRVIIGGCRRYERKSNNATRVSKGVRFTG